MTIHAHKSACMCVLEWEETLVSKVLAAVKLIH